MIRNVSFLICMILCVFFYFTFSQHAFPYRLREGNSLRRSLSLFGVEKHFTTSVDDINSTNYPFFNVLNYGAKGDGVTNDTKAFELTWNETCQTQGGVMLVPSGYTFLLQPINFDGINCQPNVTVQVDGKIVAPPNISQWVTYDIQWILFKSVKKGITIRGDGVIDGCGDSWWKTDGSDNNGSVLRPHAMRIVDSSNVTVTGIKIVNSPRMHIFIETSQYVKIFDFTVVSPGDSPNTDGIHVSQVQHVEIRKTNISCGDDCVSIQHGCHDVEIENVNCGPGHGYSIGGLGPPIDREAMVSDIVVVNSTVRDALTGLRIKTWPGGYGQVNNVTFSNIKMSDVKTPIIIDQDYCDGPKNCAVPDTDAVAISNVSFTNIKGTYTYAAVSLVCSAYSACKNITMADVELLPSVTGNSKVPYCFNAYGNVLTSTTPPLEDCLLSGIAPVPLPSPLPAIEPPPEKDEFLSYYYFVTNQ